MRIDSIIPGGTDMNLDITIREYPMRYLAGMSVRLNTGKNRVLCADLWNKVGSRMCALYCSEGDKMFGISVNVPEENAFDYWVAVETNRHTQLLSGMSRILLVGGMYATTQVSHPEMLNETFHRIYYEWSQMNPEYRADMEKPCVETYNPYWQPGDPIGVHVPLIESRMQKR